MSAACEIPLNLLLFTVGGVRFGCDADQATGMTARDGEEASDLFWFHEELGFGTRPVTYRAPTVITILTGGPRPYRVIVDALDEIAACTPHDIHLLPALLEPFARQQGIWGILPRCGQMVLLVDFQLLLKHKLSRAG